MSGDERAVRMQAHDPKLIPPLPWYLRLLGSKSRYGGRLEITLDGLWFTADLQRVVRSGRQLVVAWDDVAAVDFRPGVTPAPMGLYLRDRSFRYLGIVHKAAADRLSIVGFEPHTKPSWPDRRLWTRVGEQPDWDLLHAST
jgi:hypothetical protein